MSAMYHRIEFRKFLGRGAALALVGSLLASCGDDKSASEAQKAPPPSVVVSAAVSQDIKRSFQFIGQVSPIDDVHLVSRVSGFLEEKKIVDGAQVEKGDVLFVIEKAPYEASLSSAQADLANAKAEAALKQADLDRDEDLFKKGHVSKAKLDASEAGRDKALAMVASAEAALKQADLNLGYTDIKAPFAGRIGQTEYSVGDVVGASSEPIARLIRVAPLYVTFSITEKDYLNAVAEGGIDPRNLQTAGEPLDVTLVLPNGSTYAETGKIVFIDNLVDAKTGSITVRAEFANADQTLVSGTYVTVEIAQEEVVKALLVPQAAIQRDQKGPFVLAINAQEMVEQRYVTLGESHEAGFEVQEGLQEGERVIVQGLQKVRPGVPVNAVLDGKPVE